MAVRPIPNQTVPMVNAAGLIDQNWYEYFKSRDAVGISTSPDVKLTGLLNGQVLIWNAADLKWENGAN